MKFADLKLGTKLGTGFGILIAISVTLGVVAITNMSRVSIKSGQLSGEFVPEVEIATRIERATQRMMYEIRGFGFSEQQNFLQLGIEKQKELQTAIAEAKELASRSLHLQTLQEKISILDQEATAYFKLIEETEQTTKDLQSLRANYIQHYNNYLTNCNTYLNNQEELLREEIARRIAPDRIQERVSKIAAMNTLIDEGNNIFKSLLLMRATQDPKTLDGIQTYFSNIRSTIATIRPITRQAQNQRQLEMLDQEVGNFDKIVSQTIAIAMRRVDLASERLAVGDKVINLSNEIALAGINHTTDVAKEATFLLGLSNRVMVAGLIVALLLGVILTLFLTRLITSGIKRGVSFAESVSGGDLTVNIEETYLERKDEIGQLAIALQYMVDKLRAIVSSIRAGAENISAASLQMSSSSQHMSQGASEQASSTEEVSSSMEQMVANIQQNTDNAQQTEKIALTSAESISRGTDSARKSADAMQDIAGKISIISEIAFQTNILALNAAVEAARAGEHGKGFAVVAAEVRKLAERSRIAADEINLVSRNGVNISITAGEQLAAIVPEIEKTAKLVQEITAASLEQNSGADQVNSAIQQLNQITQQNAASSEELATSAEELSSQADQLTETISYFRLDKDDFRRAQKKLEGRAQVIKVAERKPLPEKAKRTLSKKTTNKGVRIDMVEHHDHEKDYEQY